MVELTNDCYELIFKQLSLEEQFKVVRASEILAPVVEGIWRRQYKSVDLNKLIYFRYFDGSDYKYFMTVISKTVKELKVHQRAYDGKMAYDEKTAYDGKKSTWTARKFANEKNWLDRLSCISELSFPQLKILSISLDYDLPKAIHFGKLFPTLEHFKMYYCHCPADKTKALRKSLRTIPNCKMLSELHLNTEFLEYIFDDVINLPKLHKITTCRHVSKDNDYDIKMMLRLAESSVGERVHTVNTNFTLNNPFEYSNVLECAYTFPHLQYFTMKGQYDSTCTDLSMSEFVMSSKPSLREFLFKPMDDCYEADGWNELRPNKGNIFLAHHIAANYEKGFQRIELPDLRALTPKIVFRCELKVIEHD